MFGLFKKKSIDELLQEKSDKEALEKQKQLTLETELKQMKEEIKTLFDEEVCLKWFCLDKDNHLYVFSNISFKDTKVHIWKRYERHMGTDMALISTISIYNRSLIKIEAKQILYDRIRWLKLKRQTSAFDITLTYDGQSQIP